MIEKKRIEICHCGLKERKRGRPEVGFFKAAIIFENFIKILENIKLATRLHRNSIKWPPDNTGDGALTAKFFLVWKASFFASHSQIYAKYMPPKRQTT